jgi:hypothetical protein
VSESFLGLSVPSVVRDPSLSASGSYMFFCFYFDSVAKGRLRTSALTAYTTALLWTGFSCEGG